MMQYGPTETLEPHCYFYIQALDSSVTWNTLQSSWDVRNSRHIRTSVLSLVFPVCSSRQCKLSETTSDCFSCTWSTPFQRAHSVCVICLRICHLRRRTNRYSTMTTCTIIVVNSYHPQGPFIVWEIPRVQSYILLINAGTSLQQIHKLSECGCALSLFSGVLSSSVMLTSMSLHAPRKLASFISLT